MSNHQLIYNIERNQSIGRGGRRREKLAYDEYLF
jgi:hypothetical protein